VFEDLEHLLLLHASEHKLVGVSRVLQLGISRILMSSPVSSLQINLLDLGCSSGNFESRRYFGNNFAVSIVAVNLAL
jgi:hypothetical protein